MDPHLKVEMLASAAKEFESLPRPERRRVAKAIDALESNSHPPGSVKLHGYDGYRIRVGRYRVLYLVDEAARRITVVRIGPRNDVYRRLEQLFPR
jgi:mRNA interferase RelE/StbE